jgi:hypothetical protein
MHMNRLVSYANFRIWNDGSGTLYHFNGLSAGYHLRKNLALIMRTSTDSVFPPVETGQRPVLMRLREGPLLLVSFTESTQRKAEARRGLGFTDAAGGTFRGYGIFAAVSTDDGKSWPIRKLIAPDRAKQTEPRGYLAATQTPDGLIHLISSVNYYRFSLAWLNTSAPPTPKTPSR